MTNDNDHGGGSSRTRPHPAPKAQGKLFKGHGGLGVEIRTTRHLLTLGYGSCVLCARRNTRPTLRTHATHPTSSSASHAASSSSSSLAFSVVQAHFGSFEILVIRVRSYRRDAARRDSCFGRGLKCCSASCSRPT